MVGTHSTSPPEINSNFSDIVDIILNITTTLSSNDGSYTSHETNSLSIPQGLQRILTQSTSSRPDVPYDLNEGTGLPITFDMGMRGEPEHFLAADWGNETLMSSSSFADMKNHTVMASCIMFGTGVFGNLLALIVLASSGLEQRRTLFYKLVAGLAVTDLVGTCATSPVVIAVYLNDFRWIGGVAMCHYFSFSMIFAGYATMLIVCAMAIERYVCVRHPYTYYTRFSGKLGRLTLLGCWAVSLAIASLPLIGVGSNVRQYPKTWCFFNYLSSEPSDLAFNYLYPIGALIAVLVTFVCNVRVIATLLALRTRQKSLDASETPGKRGCRVSSQRFAEVQMMVMLVGITVVFTTCFAPLMIFVLICQTSLVNYIDSEKSILLFIRLASFNPILDPWVYILFRRELVWKLVRLFRSILRLPPLLPPGPVKPQQKEPCETAGELQNGGKPPARQMSTRGSAEGPSCLSFCYQCLCLPPVPRGRGSQSQPGSRYSGAASKAARTASLAAITAKRNSTAEGQTPTNSPSRSCNMLVTKPPSSSEHVLLKKFTGCRGISRSVDSIL